MDGLWLAGGYLLEVRVMEYHVGGDLLPPRLLPPPALEPLEELRVHGSVHLYGGPAQERLGRGVRRLPGHFGLAEAHVAGATRRYRLGIAEVPEEVLAAAGGQVSVGFYIPDLGVGRFGAALEPARDGAAAARVEHRSLEPHVHNGPARDDLRHSVYHHPVQGALRYGGADARAAGELGKSNGAAAGQRSVHGCHLLAQPLPLLFQAAHLDLGPEVVAAVDQPRLLQAAEHDPGRVRIHPPERGKGVGRDVDPPVALESR